MGDQSMPSCHLWQTSEKPAVDSMKWVNAPEEVSATSCTWNPFQENWDENCMVAQERQREGPDLAPRQPGAAEVAVGKEAEKRGQEVEKDVGGQGHVTGEEDFERGIMIFDLYFTEA